MLKHGQKLFFADFLKSVHYPSMFQQTQHDNLKYSVRSGTNFIPKINVIFYADKSAVICESMAKIITTNGLSTPRGRASMNSLD